MNRNQLEKLREWVKAEAEYAVFDHDEDDEGYRGAAYAEKMEADNKFEELVESLGGGS